LAIIESQKHISIQTSEQYSNKVLSEFSGRIFGDNEEA
jgi:hypothetical protein